MFNRRGFIKLAGLTGLLPLTSLPTNPTSIKEPAAYLRNPFEFFRAVQGSTNSTSTIISLIAHKKSQIHIQIQDSLNNSHTDFEVQKIDLELNDFIVHQVFVKSLNLDLTYSLNILNPENKILKTFGFKSLDLTNQNLKVVLTSCMNHRDADPMPIMFHQFYKEKPDVIFFIGDLVYANSSMDTIVDRPATPKAAYEIFVKTLNDFPLYNQKFLTPIFSSFDDHDFGYNNADATHPHLKIMQKMCRAFFPIDSRTSLAQGPGHSFYVEAFGMRNIFLDTRSFKNSKKDIYLGQEQLKWVIQVITQSPLPLFIIGSQQFWNYGRLSESFERQGNIEFKQFLNAIRISPAPAVFASGDVHYSQVQKLTPEILGYKSYELTSSAFFSSSAQIIGLRSEADGQLKYYGYPNFLVLDRIQTTDQKLQFNLRCVSEDLSSQFEYSVDVQK